MKLIIKNHKIKRQENVVRIKKQLEKLRSDIRFMIYVIYSFMYMSKSHNL